MAFTVAGFSDAETEMSEVIAKYICPTDSEN